MKPNSNQSLLIGLGPVWGLAEATPGWGTHLLELHLYQFAFTGWRARMSTLIEPNSAFHRMIAGGNLFPFRLFRFIRTCTHC